MTIAPYVNCNNLLMRDYSTLVPIVSLMRTAIAAVILITFLSGCGLFDSGSFWRAEQFEVIWIDLHSDSHLAYRIDSSTTIGIVDSCVFAAGANEQYIAVKQRPFDDRSTVYYVIEKAKYNPSRVSPDAIIGPLSETEFQALGRGFPLPVLELLIPEAACNTAA